MPGRSSGRPRPRRGFLAIVALGILALTFGGLAAPAPAAAGTNGAVRFVMRHEHSNLPAMAGQQITFDVMPMNGESEHARFFTDTVHFTSTDPWATLPADYTYSCDIPYTIWCADDHTDGTAHVFMFTFITAGHVTLNVVDVQQPSIAGSLTFDVVAAPAASLTLAGLPATTTAGAVTALKATLRDQYGNVATGYGGTVRMASSDSAAVLAPDHTFTGGDADVAWLPVSFRSAGSQSVTVTDMVAGFLHASSSTTVVAAPHIGFDIAFTTDPPSAYAGDNISGILGAFATATVLDPSYRGTVHFTSSDAYALLPSDFTFTAGMGGYDSYVLSDVQFQTAGSQTLTATDISNSLITGTVTFDVLGGSVATIALQDLPTATIAGATPNVVVVIRDQFGNLSQDIKTVQLLSSDPQAALPADFLFHATDFGSHTFSLSLKTAGSQSGTARIKSQWSINTSASAVVLPDAVAKLSVFGMPNPSQSRIPGSVTVQARDAFDNPVHAYTGTVHFTSSDWKATLPANYTFTGPEDGARGFSVTLRLLGTSSITVTDTGTPSITGSQTGIVVVPDASGATYVSLAPARILDTRSNTGLSGTFTSAVPRSLQVTGAGGVPSGAIAVTGNVTVTNQSSAGIVSLTTVSTPSPTTSTINFPTGDNRANGVTAPLGSGGVLWITYMGSVGGTTTDLLFDVTGYFVP